MLLTRPCARWSHAIRTFLYNQSIAPGPVIDVIHHQVIFLARRILSICANSASCKRLLKRLFSIFGTSLTKLRSRLGTNTLNALSMYATIIKQVNVSNERLPPKTRAMQQPLLVCCLQMLCQPLPCPLTLLRHSHPSPNQTEAIHAKN